jgi:hypothetical protein
MFQVPRQPFGRQITNRMAAVARHAQLLADSVNAGDQGIRAFGRLGLDVPNATELEALSGLGGSERSPYRLRFAQTPLAPGPRDAMVLQVTPGQQRIMADAAVYLRTEQPRPDVTVEGVVVRLSRDHIHGPGTVVVEGVADDSGALRRFYLWLLQMAPSGPILRDHPWPGRPNSVTEIPGIMAATGHVLNTLATPETPEGGLHQQRAEN